MYTKKQYAIYLANVEELGITPLSFAEWKNWAIGNAEYAKLHNLI